MIMAQGLLNSTALYDCTAISANGIAGIAVFGAGSSLDVLKLCIGMGASALLHGDQGEIVQLSAGIPGKITTGRSFIQREHTGRRVFDGKGHSAVIIYGQKQLICLGLIYQCTGVIAGPSQILAVIIGHIVGAIVIHLQGEFLCRICNSAGNDFRKYCQPGVFAKISGLRIQHIGHVLIVTGIADRRNVVNTGVVHRGITAAGTDLIHVIVTQGRDGLTAYGFLAVSAGNGGGAVIGTSSIYRFSGSVGMGTLLSITGITGNHRNQGQIHALTGLIPSKIVVAGGAIQGKIAHSIRRLVMKLNSCAVSTGSQRHLQCCICSIRKGAAVTTVMVQIFTIGILNIVSSISILGKGKFLVIHSVCCVNAFRKGRQTRILSLITLCGSGSQIIGHVEIVAGGTFCGNVVGAGVILCGSCGHGNAGQKTQAHDQCQEQGYAALECFHKEHLQSYILYSFFSILLYVDKFKCHRPYFCIFLNYF